MAPFGQVFRIALVVLGGRSGLRKSKAGRRLRGAAGGTPRPPRHAQVLSDLAREGQAAPPAAVSSESAAAAGGASRSLGPGQDPGRGTAGA